MSHPQIHVAVTPPVERQLEGSGLTQATLVELGAPIVTILEPGKRPRRFVAIQGTDLIAPEQVPLIIPEDEELALCRS